MRTGNSLVKIVLIAALLALAAPHPVWAAARWLSPRFRQSRTVPMRLDLAVLPPGDPDWVRKDPDRLCSPRACNEARMNRRVPSQARDLVHSPPVKPRQVQAKAPEAQPIFPLE